MSRNLDRLQNPDYSHFQRLSEVQGMHFPHRGSHVPQPPAGHRWKEVRHDNTVTWLASWTENVQGSCKYVMLNANSKLKVNIFYTKKSSLSVFKPSSRPYHFVTGYVTLLIIDVIWCLVLALGPDHSNSRRIFSRSGESRSLSFSSAPHLRSVPLASSR